MSKSKKKKKKTLPQGGNGKKMERFGLLYPRSAGIDVGSMLMIVSYTDRQDMIQLREFNSFTDSLYLLADLLKQDGVEIVTMEATGSYWQALFSILEDRGLKVIIINPSHYRNVAAQKTDIQDAQWLHQLLTHGLLRNSHIATEPYRELRHYIHERALCQDQKGDLLNRIQKNLTLMNIKFQHLISDIEGVAGMKLLRAIALGISEPEILLKQIDYHRLKASPEDLLSSLKGDYRQGQVNILKCSLDAYDFLKGQMLKYEDYIEETLKELLPEDIKRPNQSMKKKGVVRKNQYHFKASDYLHAIFGVDLTEVEGLDEIGLLTILAVTGTDMSKWPTAAHFSSWLNLSPRPKITGGRVIGYQKRVTHNPATQAFRLAANSLWQSKGPLGRLYRKLAATKGSSKAIKAVARRMAVIFYNMVLKKEAFDIKKVEQDTAVLEAKKIARLQRELAKYGYNIKKSA
jgi:transposase